MQSRLVTFVGLICMLETVPASAACDVNNRLTNYLMEWLNSNPDFAAVTRGRVFRSEKDASVYVDWVVREYKTYFNQSKEAIAEIDLCEKSEIVDLTGAILGRIVRQP